MEATQTVDPAGEADTDSRPALPRGATLDRYVVLHPLGTGGMGVVYCAFDPELDRRVALKVVHPRRLAAHSGRRTQQRLAREAQALARLNHPNVLAVHDVGVVGGQLYVATELVDGSDLAAWLEGAPRRREEVIEVFLQAGAGLAAAHAAGLVHRDFKLSNVMVGRDGRVRVVDFGLASRDPALDEAAREEEQVPVDKGDQTEPGAGALAEGLPAGFHGTPTYAAPEQLAGQSVTAASDQFSFCVSLCRALTDASPFPPEAFEKPTDPSAWTPDPRVLAQVPASLRRLLRRGLSFDPAARYPSIEALLDDLRSIHGRRRKRRRLAGLVAVATGAAAFVALGLTWRQQQVCTGGAERFATVWGQPQRAAVASALLGSGLSYADASRRSVEAILDSYGEDWAEMHRATCRATAVEGAQSAELLDRRMACLDNRLYEVAALVEVLQRGGVAEHAVAAAGDLGPITACADAEALLATTAPPVDPDQARAIDELRRRLASAEVLLSSTDSSAVRAPLEELVKEAEALGYWPLTAEVLLFKGRLEKSLGQPEAADESLGHALEAAQAGGHNRVAAAAFVDRVWVAGYQQADFSRSERYAQQAEAALSHLGQSQELTATLAGNWGVVLTEKGRFEEALAAHQNALEVWSSARGPEDTRTGVALARVGDVLLETGALEEAGEHFTAALDIARRQYGETHPLTARLMTKVGTVWMERGDAVAARGYFQQALAVARATRAADHPFLATSLAYLGHALVAVGAYPEATSHYREALAILEAATTPDPRRIAAVVSGLANAAYSTEDYDEASRGYARVLELRRSVYGDEHPTVADAAFNLGEIAKEQGNPKAALTRYRQALAIWEQTMPDNGFRIAAGLTGVGEALVDLGDAASALPLLERALALHPAGRAGEFLATTQFSLARAIAEQGGDLTRARELATAALEGFATSRASAAKHIEAVEEWLAKHPLRS